MPKPGPVPPLARLTLRGIRSTSGGLAASPMRVYGSYAVVYIIDGNGRFADARGTERRVASGDLMLVFPDVAHTYGPDRGHTWLESFLCFDGAVFDLWRKRRLLDERDPVWRLEPVGYWARRIEAVVAPQGDADRTLDTDDATGLQRACQLQQLLADAIAHRRERRIGDTQLQWVEQAKAAIDRTVMSAVEEDVDWSAVCEPLAIGYETFRKRFTKLTGTPPAKYRMARVIDRACQLLRDHPDRKLRAIADDLGFCDEFHFSKRFKQLVGVWPADFRRRVGRPPAAPPVLDAPSAPR